MNEQLHVPPAVTAHGRVVADMVRRIAWALDHPGVSMNLQLNKRRRRPEPPWRVDRVAVFQKVTDLITGHPTDGDFKKWFIP